MAVNVVINRNIFLRSLDHATHCLIQLQIKKDALFLNVSKFLGLKDDAQRFCYRIYHCLKNASVKHCFSI